MAKGKKTGGRSAGTPNKATQSLMEICDAEGVDFFRALVKIAKDPEHPHYWDAIKEGNQYLHAKRKAIEHSGKLDPSVLEQAEELARMSEDELKALIKSEMDKK